MPNQRRQRLPVPWGEGLDRASGAMAIAPSSFTDLRNVRLADGRVEYRKGLARLTAISGATAILAVTPIRAQGLAAVVTYHDPTRVVSLYFVDATGTDIAFVATLYVIPAGAASPPSIIMAASYDKLLIAHDEANFALRQQTMVYAPADNTVTPLLADFAREGTSYPVKFRGVARHLAYLVGWGYGQHSSDPAVDTEDRPETLRISDPGEPTTFQPEHYFLVGQQGDPIIGCGPVGGVLGIGKAGESYKLVGYDRTTFGVVPLDPQFGLLASKLHVSVGVRWYVWTLSGPRVTTGGEMADLAEPLWLNGPVPDPLAAATPEDQGFAYYDPIEDEVAFVFGRWGYVLHRAGETRWSYREYGVPLLCAGLVFTGGNLTISPPDGVTPGTPSWVQPQYLPGDADPKFYVPWTWRSAAPTERAEVWLKPSGGAWAARANVPASYGEATVAEPGGAFLTNYDIAVRFLFGSTPAPGYESNDPTLWPAESKVTVYAGGTPTKFMLGIFRRVSATELSLYSGLAQLPGVGQLAPAAYVYRIEKSLDQVTWDAVTTGSPPASPWVDIRLPNTDATLDYYFRIRAELGAEIGDWLVVGPKKIQPEPPASVAVGASLFGDIPSGADDHPVSWTKPAPEPGGPTPADGPYDIKGQHYDGQFTGNVGAFGTTDQVGFGARAHTYHFPDFTVVGNNGRGAMAFVRVNNGQGDVSDWVTATHQEGP